MGMFKIGDRVRVVRNLKHRPKRCAIGHYGAAGTVVHISGHKCIADYFVVFDDYKSDFVKGAFSMHEYQLVLADDPKADEFIERIKKLKPYDEPRVEPQREHIGSPDWP